MTPANGSTVTAAPTEIVATFTEPLDPSKSSIVVLNASGAQIASGGQVDAADAKKMTLALPPLEAGTYQVRWTSDSAQDGDLDRGTTGFTYAPAPTPSASVGRRGAPAAPSPRRRRRPWPRRSHRRPPVAANRPARPPATSSSRSSSPSSSSPGSATGCSAAARGRAGRRDVAAAAPGGGRRRRRGRRPRGPGSRLGARPQRHLPVAPAARRVPRRAALTVACRSRS